MWVCHQKFFYNINLDDQLLSLSGKSLSEALIFASTNPKYDNWLFIELQVLYMKISSSNLGRTRCVQKLFLTFRTIYVHNRFSPCSVKRRASDKDLPVTWHCNKSWMLPNYTMWRSKILIFASFCNLVTKLQFCLSLDSNMTFKGGGLNLTNADVPVLPLVGGQGGL